MAVTAISGACGGVPAAGPFVCWDLETVPAPLAGSAQARALWGACWWLRGRSRVSLPPLVCKSVTEGVTHGPAGRSSC